MLTVSLWIALIFLFVLFLLVISPVRFGVSAKYANSGRFNYEFFVSYLHPVFLKLLYSSESGNALKILGKSFKLKQKKSSEASERKSFEDSEDIDRKIVMPQESESGQSSGEFEEERSDYETKSAKESTPALEEVHEESESQEKQASLFDRIKERVKKIKRSRAYQFLSNAVWRKKIKSWLERFLKGALTVIVFHRLSIWAKVGLMDPAALGKLCGYFNAARSALSLRNRKADMVLEPFFMKECLEFEIELRGGTSLMRAASCFFIALLTFPYFRTYKVWRRKNI
jgi:hypothetical protein